MPRKLNLSKEYIEMHSLIKNVAKQQGVRKDVATRLTNKLGYSKLYLDELRSIKDVSTLKLIGDARTDRKIYYPDKNSVTYKLLVAVKEYLDSH